MDIKVREVTDVESKSTQQVEQELLDKHEQQQQQVEEPVVEEQNTEVQEEQPVEEVEEKVEENVEETPVAQEPEPQPYEVQENDVLSYIGKRYGKEVNSIDELVSARQEAEELPSDVAAYLKYKKETGRGFEDYARLQKDYSDLLLPAYDLNM